MTVKLFDSELKVMDVLWKEGICQQNKFQIYSKKVPAGT